MMKDRELKQLLQINTESPDYASKDAFIRRYKKETGSEKTGHIKLVMMQAVSVFFLKKIRARLVSPHGPESVSL